MRLARPDKQRGTTSPHLRGNRNPPPADQDEAERLLRELAGDDEDPLDEADKKPHKTAKKK